MEWNAKYSVGVDYLDAQHQKIISYINQVELIAKNSELGVETPIAELIIVLDSLSEFTRTHFNDEERLMARHNMPDIKRHKEIHKNLLLQVDKLREKVTVHGAAVLPVLVKFLNDWLQTHILGVDRSYTTVIGKRESP